MCIPLSDGIGEGPVLLSPPLPASMVTGMVRGSEMKFRSQTLPNQHNIPIAYGSGVIEGGGNILEGRYFEVGITFKNGIYYTNHIN
jgi:hypothetical protein